METLIDRDIKFLPSGRMQSKGSMALHTWLLSFQTFFLPSCPPPKFPFQDEENTPNQ